jgi:autotransporter-associated beta strand protein
VTNNAGASITGGQYGIIAGDGGSSVFNVGTISGGAAAIQFAGSGNTLTLAPGSVISGNVLGTGSDTFQLGGTGAGTFDVSTLGPAAQYGGFSTFNKIGSSIWTLTGTSTYAGPVNVNGGTLAVNGDITSSSGVTVNAGGTLGGNGTVGNTTINAGGTLAPGNSIGLLTVQGSLVFTAASSYMVEVSPANADRTNVTGVATLGGATVNASFAAGTYVAKQYTILNAAGGLGGSTFGSVVNTNLPSGFKSSLSYDANNAYLNLALSFIAPPTAGLSGNQQSVGNALVNFFNSNGGIPLVFGGLTAAGLSQASGETAVGSQQTTFDAMTQFMGVMTDPFIAGRGDGANGGVGATPFAEEGGNPNAYAVNGKPRTRSERDAYAAIYRKAPPMADPFAQRWSMWAAGYGGSQTTDGNAALGSNNTTSRVFGMAAGADYRVSPFTLAGFALAGGGTNFSVANGGSGRSDLFQAGAFVRHTVGPAYISAALAYGWQDITTDRTITIAGVNQLRAQFNANAFSGRVEGGYRFVTPWMGVTPYAAGQFTTFDLPAYAEQALSGANTFALSYGAKSVTATRSELGLRTDKSWAMTDAIFTLRGRVAWAHDFNTDRNIAATFQTLPGASFVVDGAAQAHDAALTTASAEMKFISGLSLAATFEGEFSDVTRSYAGKGVVRYAW